MFNEFSKFDYYLLITALLLNKDILKGKYIFYRNLIKYKPHDLM